MSKKAVIMGLMMAVMMVIVAGVAMAQFCNNEISIPSVCPGGTPPSTSGWLYDTLNLTYDYQIRPTVLFTLLINGTDSYSSLCADPYTPVTSGITFNATIYSATPTCNNASIAYILNNWTIDCAHVDNISAAQSAVWYFVFLNDSVCTSGNPQYNHSANPGDPGWESNWIPDCNAHPLACNFINSSINKSVPYDITLSATPPYIAGNTIPIQAQVSYTSGTDRKEVQILFTVDNPLCYFDNGSQSYTKQTTGGIAKANLTCGNAGIVAVNATIKDAKWFSYVDPTNCNLEDYQATLIIENITAQTTLNIQELQPPTFTTQPSKTVVHVGDAVYDVAYFSVPAGQPEVTGNVSFYLCDPTEVVGSECPNGSGTFISENPVVGGTATSDSVVVGVDIPLIEGTWCWRANYSGDNNYTAQTHTGRDECFYLDPTPPRVPALSFVGLIGLAGAIVIVSTMMLRRR